MKIYRMTGRGRRVPAIGRAVAASLILAAGATQFGPAFAADDAATKANATPCGALEAVTSVDQSITGLSSIDGLKIDSAKPAQFGSTTGCRVDASLAAQGGAAPLRFVLDLPEHWNLRGVQLTIGIDAGAQQQPSPQAAFDPARAVANGFAVFGALRAAGNGAGQTASGGTDDAAVDTQKRIRDAAAELLARRFNRFPDRFYLIADAAGAEQALALAARHPRAYRGMLVDASGATAGASSATAASNDAGAPANSAADGSNRIDAYAADGGKLLVVAPAAESVAGPLAIVRFQHDQLAKKGRRYADDFVRLFPVSDAAAARATDWLPMLVDWAENLKAPSAPAASATPAASSTQSAVSAPLTAAEPSVPAASPDPAKR